MIKEKLKERVREELHKTCVYIVNQEYKCTLVLIQ